MVLQQSGSFDNRLECQADVSALGEFDSLILHAVCYSSLLCTDFLLYLVFWFVSLKTTSFWAKQTNFLKLITRPNWVPSRPAAI